MVTMMSRLANQLHLEQQVNSKITKEFNADRNKSNFESGVDSLIFNAPAPRRKDNQGTASDTKPAPPTPEVKKPVPVQPPPITVIILINLETY